MMVRDASSKAVIVDVLHLSVVRLAAAVHEILSPFMTDMREDLAAVKENLKSLTETVNELSRDLEEVKNQSKPEAIEESVLQGILPLINNLEQNLREIVDNVTQEPQNTDVEYVPPLHECGGTGGWRRVVYLNMTDPNTNCPSGWNLTTYSKRTCGKVNTLYLTCDSVFFPVSGGNYTSVCGSIRAYQYGQVDAFQAYHDGFVSSINGAYVAGVSLTHGSPRQHIWTFAAARSETHTNDEGCPCNGARVTIPPFVCGDYFCESGVNSGSADGFHPDDPLWDGEGCRSSSSCCSFNNPPYFTKQLPSPTSDPIEARLCRWESNDDSPVEFMELYVK